MRIPMNDHPVTRRIALSIAGLCLSRVTWATPAELPGDSVYQLHAALVDQDGRALELSSLRGQPLLVGMFYTSCEMVCPMIFETIHATLKALPAAEQQATRVLMVTFDPERDTVPVLKQTAKQRGCDARWTLARCDDDTVRKLAAALGIQYRRLASGEYNHSSPIELLDRQGRIAARTGQLGHVDAAFVQATRQAHRSRA
jgi:protein SCO1/2